MGQDGRGEPTGAPRPAALLAIRISPADVGSRVTIRHRIVDADAHLTDVRGYLREWAAGVLTVEVESGQLIDIPEHIVVAAKVIPSRRARVSGSIHRPDPPS